MSWGNAMAKAAVTTTPVATAGISQRPPAGRVAANKDISAKVRYSPMASKDSSAPGDPVARCHPKVEQFAAVGPQRHQRAVEDQHVGQVEQRRVAIDLWCKDASDCPAELSNQDHPVGRDAAPPAAHHPGRSAQREELEHR